MTNYGDSDNVKILLENIIDDVSDNMISYALDFADKTINSKGIDVTGPNVETAAELYAASFILDKLYDTSEKLSPLAEKWEKKANNLLSEEVHPYSNSQTPNPDYGRHIEEPGTAPAMDMNEERTNQRKVLNRDPGTW